jgi:hypothetical protein
VGDEEEFASLRPLGFEQITSLGSAVGFASIPAGATVALVSVNTAPVRMRDDGTSPTASVGLRFPNGLSPYRLQGDLSKVKWIAESGSPVIDVLYYST